MNIRGDSWLFGSDRKFASSYLLEISVDLTISFDSMSAVEGMAVDSENVTVQNTNAVKPYVYPEGHKGQVMWLWHDQWGCQGG